MPLSAGDRLGPYEILAQVGAGGMGEVYRARDTRLDRIVAVKVSKDEFSERFEREARNVAQLNHPNICTLHDVGANYLVMEFVEGETLAGPLPIDTCLNYARQIIEAIEAAHDKGIVHRDLKPANIKVTPEGTVKVLDFGLAKALDAEVSTAPGPDSPTLSMAMTRVGMILGTAAYMSPEQAKGKQADRRADIWAFGVVLFEMLTGKQVFTGETTAETLASVMMAQIPLDRLPDTTPAALRQVVGRCLERDVRRRFQAIGEARITLENQETGTEVRRQTEVRPTWRSWIPWAVSAMLFLALAALAYFYFKPSAPPIITRFPITLGEGQILTTNNHRYLATSPDGSQIAYVANSRLYLRSMADLTARPIPGTEGTITNPVFSPDGKSLVFHVNQDKMFKRVAVSGGAAVAICPTEQIPGGASWGTDGIVFAQQGKGILRVSPNGGTPELLISAKENEQFEGPQILPGGKAVLMTVASGPGQNSAAWDKGRIVVQTLKTGARKTVLEGGTDGHYLPTGHLAYALNGVLFAAPFDLGRLETTSGPVSLVEGVSRVISGSAQFAFSDSGALIYVPGPISGAGLGNDVLALIDRKGNAEPLTQLMSAAYDNPRVSRDGKRVAYEVSDGKESSIWVYELSGSVAPRRLTLPGIGSNSLPVWHPDGEHVAFQSDREGDQGIWWQRADGSAPAQRLTKAEKGESHRPDSWSRDGQTLSFSLIKSNGSVEMAYSVRDKKSTLLAQGPYPYLGASVFSPDGRWVVFQTGDGRVYVQPFPPTGARYQAPAVGVDHHPLWSPDGKELFYVPGNRRLVSVSVTTQPTPSFGKPLEASKAGFTTKTNVSPRNFDILPDGQHFIGVIPAGESSPGNAAQQIQVVLNWFEDV